METRFCCVVLSRGSLVSSLSGRVTFKQKQQRHKTVRTTAAVKSQWGSGAACSVIVCHSVKPAGTFLHRRIHSEKKKYVSRRTRLFRWLHVGASFSPVWFWINILYPLNGWIAPVWWQEAKLEKHFHALPPRPSAVIYYLQLGPWWMTVCM